ncbi:Na+/H+ antiporter NhaA [Camelimonas lactis]|uniref:Na(+)/H(+) antiporter NhaA n=1 Tax=Camelimonas lactis TaxID=659006 RepID=A0A4R2GSF1_9HYPH|nr:Na+/H+ antiporter NhaA [Camelimonas lactis]TCO13047.1 NhaA family Na+:H+ antiporter [Camelimonas lactis]
MAGRLRIRPFSMFRAFLDNQASGGIVLMFAAAAALVVANSPLSASYFGALATHLGPLSVAHWINDALMAVFFLFVGLEIKREMLDGQLATWPRRILPGVAALGGMIVPALIYAALNHNNPATMRGWAIPTATDIAFALGVLSLLGNRVPAALKVFLTALAIIDDLGAVIIIALFYTAQMSLPALGGAALTLAALVLLNRRGVLILWPYLLLGVVLWIFVLKSGVHATIAGVLLALTIPLRRSPGLRGDLPASPLHRLEHALHYVTPFVIIPVFGFANAGVSLAGMTLRNLWDPLTLGVASGLLVGKLAGVFGFAWATIRLGFVEMPANSRWSHLFGVALLCGVGFTMSLFIGLLAFEGHPDLQNEVKLGIIVGSVLAALAGALALRLSPMPAPQLAEAQSA